MGYPEKCDICLNDRVLTRFGQRNLQLAVRPFHQVRDAKVMLVGLNPTLIRKEARVVLELDDAYSQICRFVAGDVLKPAGIDLNKHVYATNLVKCTFSKEPRIMSKEEAGKDGNEAVKRLLLPFFRNCRKYFEEEIGEISPKILIAFGEKTHKLITEEYGLTRQGVKKGMKNAFGNIDHINLLGHDIAYVPCIRPVARRHTFFANSWEGFLKRLKETASEMLNS